MSRLPVQPTKSNLLQLRDDLDFSKTGHQLLSEKREILLMRIKSLINELIAVQTNLTAALNTGYKKLRKAILTLGWAKLEMVHIHPEGDVEIEVSEKPYLGIDLPTFSASKRSNRPSYSPAGSSSTLDEAQAAFTALIPVVVEYSQRQAQLVALSIALKKTMKRVNALENVFIPDYVDTVSYVEETLEEIEREEMYVRKLVKELKEQ